MSHTQPHPPHRVGPAPSSGAGNKDLHYFSSSTTNGGNSSNGSNSSASTNVVEGEPNARMSGQQPPVAAQLNPARPPPSPVAARTPTPTPSPNMFLTGVRTRAAVKRELEERASSAASNSNDDNDDNDPAVAVESIRRHHLAQHINATKRQRRQSYALASSAGTPSADAAALQPSTSSSMNLPIPSFANAIETALASDFPPPPSPVAGTSRDNAAAESGFSAFRRVLFGSSSMNDEFSPYFNSFNPNACPSLKSISQTLNNESLLSPATHPGPITANAQSTAIVNVHRTVDGFEPEDVSDGDDDIEVVYSHVKRKAPAAADLAMGENSTPPYDGSPAAGEVKSLVRFLQKQLSDQYGDEDGEEGADDPTLADDNESVSSDVVCVKTTKDSALSLTVQMQRLRQEKQTAMAEKADALAQLCLLHDEFAKKGKEADSTRRELDDLGREANSLRIQVQDQSTEIKNLKGELEASKQESTCVVCFEARRDTVFVPCWHYQCCSKCSSNITECCYCRQSIAGKVKLFQ